MKTILLITLATLLVTCSLQDKVNKEADGWLNESAEWREESKKQRELLQKEREDLEKESEDLDRKKARVREQLKDDNIDNKERERLQREQERLEQEQERVRQEQERVRQEQERLERETREREERERREREEREEQEQERLDKQRAEFDKEKARCKALAKSEAKKETNGISGQVAYLSGWLRYCENQYSDDTDLIQDCITPYYYKLSIAQSDNGKCDSNLGWHRSICINPYCDIPLGRNYHNIIFYSLYCTVKETDYKGSRICEVNCPPLKTDLKIRKMGFSDWRDNSNPCSFYDDDIREKLSSVGVNP